MSADLRAALEARLEHSHAEYAEAKDGVRRSITVVFVIGSLHIVFALLVWFASTSADSVPTPIDSWAETLPIMTNSAVGLLLLACALAARRAPKMAFAAALGAWLLVEVAVYAVMPALFFLAFLSAAGVARLFVKILVTFVLARGILAARRVDAIRGSSVTPSG